MRGTENDTMARRIVATRVTTKPGVAGFNAMAGEEVERSDFKWQGKAVAQCYVQLDVAVSHCSACHSRKFTSLCSPRTIFPLSSTPLNTNPFFSNTRTLATFPPSVYPDIRRTPILGIAHECRTSFIAADMIPRPWCDGAR